jgi:hypothetical protein
MARTWPFPLAGCALLLLCGTGAARGEAIPVDLTFLPPSGGINRLTIQLSVTYGVTRTDTDTADVSGNVLAELTAQFNHATHRARLSGLEFTGGTCAITPVSLTVSFPFVGSIVVETTELGGAFDTPSPPGAVSGTIFQAAEHRAMVSHGQVSAYGTGAIGGLFEPMSIDLSQEPLPVTGMGMGTLDIPAPRVFGRQATYDAILTLPVTFDEVLHEEAGVTVRAAGGGTFKARGEFTRTVPRLGDFDGDEFVTAFDIRLLAAHIPSSDPAYDVTGDWQVDGEDMDALIEDVLQTVYGDADLDGDVDFLDYLAVKAHFGAEPPVVAGWPDGDFDGDGDVDFEDYCAGRSNFGWCRGEGGLGGAPAPEPATLLLTLAGALAALRRRRPDWIRR